MIGLTDGSEQCFLSDLYVFLAGIYAKDVQKLFKFIGHTFFIFYYNLKKLVYSLIINNIKKFTLYL